MKYTITCKDENTKKYIHNLLINPLSGSGCLFGVKNCIDYHNMLPDVLEFDLTQEEIDAIRKLPNINYVIKDSQKIFNSYNKKSQYGIPYVQYLTCGKDILNQNIENNNLLNQNDIIPYSLLVHQNYNVNSIIDSLSSAKYQTLSSIDCSNVDIIVADTGVFKTHYEFFTPEGYPQVVEFDWSQLKDDTNNQIASMPNFYYSYDPSIFPGGYLPFYNHYNLLGGDLYLNEPHGTACASLAAGKTCGFAKNAKIYPLRILDLQSNDVAASGWDTVTCMKLALSFLKAKKQNLYGLNSKRPTIMTNSWGYQGYYIAPSIQKQDLSHNNFNSCTQYGSYNNTHNISRTTGQNSVVDSYIRQIINQGAIVTVAAGNNNTYLTNTPQISTFVHVFSASNGKYFCNISTPNNNNIFSVNSIYNDVLPSTLQYKYLGKDIIYPSYSSPNIGIGYNKNDYPIFIVGDVTACAPIYNVPDSAVPCGSINQAVNTYHTLSSISNDENRIINKRYSSKKGPYYLKSTYSNFGPDVDVWASGNGNVVAFGTVAQLFGYYNGPLDYTQTLEIFKNLPYINNSVGYQIPQDYYTYNGYIGFNGTSAATPIVAGIIATYLADNPSSTPLQTRQWLLTTSVSGNILETQGGVLPVSCYNYYNNLTNILNFQLGSTNMNNMTFDSYNLFSEVILSYQSSFSPSWVSQFKYPNIDDILFNCRFFDSNNLIAQAYPLRKAVEQVNNANITISGQILTNNGITTESPTHNNFS
jgi:subtilisin family serine protease